MKLSKKLLGNNLKINGIMENFINIAHNKTLIIKGNFNKKVF